MEDLEDDLTRIMTRSASYVEAYFYGLRRNRQITRSRHNGEWRVEQDDWLDSVEEQDDLNTWNQNSCQEDPSHRLNIAHATQPTVDCRAGGCGIGRGS